MPKRLLGNKGGLQVIRAKLPYAGGAGNEEHLVRPPFRSCGASRAAGAAA